MSHEITVRENGFQEAAFARTPAWHGLGKVLDHEMTSNEALEVAGLDWQVVQQVMGRFVGKDISAPQAGDWLPCIDPQGEPTVLANIRQDTGLYLGNVSGHYKVIQNREAFNFMDSLCETEEIRYEAAFSLSGGKKVMILARMPGEFVVAGEEDRILPYVLFANNHDGAGAIKIGPTAVRVVCANTYAMALQQDGGKRIQEFSIRHSEKMTDNLDKVRRILGEAKQRMAHHAEACGLLADYRFTKAEFATFLNLMCPELPPEDPDYTERRANAINETRQNLSLEYQDECNDESPMTAWAAFNAVTAHIDHLPRRGATHSRKAEARWNVTQYGAGRDQKLRAFVAACRMAKISEDLIQLAC